MKTILFVDDESSVLKALNRAFLEEEYRVLLADSGDRALDIMKEEKIDLIITDMRMPKTDGYRLLKRVKRDHKETIRLILSGYADEKLIFQALQNNLAKMYLLKPWDNNELLDIIQRVFSIDDLLQSKKNTMNVNMFEDLPTFKTFYHTLSSLIDSDEDIDKITSVIEADQAMTSRILRIANSAFYSVKTASIKQAIVYLGYSNIKNIVLTTTLFDNKNLSPHEKEPLWNHSNLCNRILHMLYRNLLDSKLQDVTATAGLLHDIGKVFLLTNFPEEYSLINREMKRETLPLCKVKDLEEEYIGISHQEVGAYLLDWWELPLPVVEAALFHHEPENKNIIHQELVACVHLANYYSWRLEKREVSVSPEAFRILKIQREECDEMIEKNKAKILERMKIR